MRPVDQLEWNSAVRNQQIYRAMILCIIGLFLMIGDVIYVFTSLLLGFSGFLIGVAMVLLGTLFLPARIYRGGHSPQLFEFNSELGIRINCDSVRVIGFITFMGIMSVASIFLILAGLTGEGGHFTRATPTFLILTGLSVCLITLWMVVEIAFNRLKSPWLILTPTHIIYQSVGAGALVDWNSVIEVAAFNSSGNLEIHICANDYIHSWKSSQFWRKISKLPSQKFLINLRELSIDPVILLRMIRFYHKNINFRDELGDQRALQRIISS